MSTESTKPAPTPNLASLIRDIGSGPYINPLAHVHPTAVIWPGAMIGPDVTIEAGVRVGPRSRIGAHSRIGAGTIIDGFCRIANHVRTDDRCSIHGAAMIEPYCELGRRVEIGEGAHLCREVLLFDDVTVEPGAIVPPSVHLEPGFVWTSLLAP